MDDKLFYLISCIIVEYFYISEGVCTFFNHNHICITIKAKQLFYIYYTDMNFLIGFIMI